jgi:two-component system nitrate/nitrite response regulator NarL
MTEDECAREAVALNLTRRELDVLRLLVEGHGDIEITRRLGFSPRTVQDHVANLRKKTGQSNRVALAVHAVQKGWV